MSAVRVTAVPISTFRIAELKAISSTSSGNTVTAARLDPRVTAMPNMVDRLAPLAASSRAVRFGAAAGIGCLMTRPNQRAEPKATRTPYPCGGS